MPAVYSLLPWLIAGARAERVGRQAGEREHARRVRLAERPDVEARTRVEVAAVGADEVGA